MVEKLLMGIRQTVRHRILIPAFTGSIPVCPVQELILLTNQERKEVIRLHNNGKSYKEIAEHFNVNKSTIREIIKKHESK